MPYGLTDEMLQHMIQKGYIVVSDEDYLGETLYEFGKIPPESDEMARALFFALYREALQQGYTIHEDKVMRPTLGPKDRPRRHRRRR